MALSWNEIKSRAVEFVREWEGEARERAESQSFYNDFFNVFGISRRRVASFEAPVKKLGEKQGFIDLLWKGTLLVEHKSKDRNLGDAHTQALDYFPNLKEEELPKYILVSDFNEFELYDLESNEEHKFTLKEFPKYVHLFGFIAGYKKRVYKDLEPVNIEASELMGNLFDKLAASGYTEHDLELFLVRVLFCLFADDTGIFEADIFKYFIEEKTKEDGSDVGSQIATLFQVLNTPENKRQKTLDEDLARFPYINGNLFEKAVLIPSFDKPMRDALLKCCYFNWSNISPAIFGSLFQSVSDGEKRRSLGEHYTSEKNIMKTISPLFLDELYAEFKKAKKTKKKLIEFHKKIAGLKFLDPACGCGNFLVISYREMRKLEIEVLKCLYSGEQQELDVGSMSQIDVDNFYGIEIEEFPAKIAETALWLLDHQMNIELSEAFGKYYARIPLKKSAKIVQANALTIDWKEVVKPEELSYILGNPPFIGKQYRSKEQQDDLKKVFGKIKGAGVLDYVTAWYIKASEYIASSSPSPLRGEGWGGGEKPHRIKCAFVSTNSITQGEQVGILWNELFNNYGIKIHFAHRTFAWDNEAKGKAHVHCVIIGFANWDTDNKKLFDYNDIKGEAHETIVENINPYLLAGKDIVVTKRSKPVCDVSNIVFGSMPNDGGNLLFTDEEKEEFLKQEPKAEKYIRRIIGSQEFINNINRWCLWLKDISPNELKQMPLVLDRVKKVKEYRLKSTRKTTRELADFPALFGEIRQPKTDYLCIPLNSSSRRVYIPIGFIDSNVISNNKCSVIPEATLYQFGLMSSIMHMIWTKYVCGRIKSDYNYSNTLVYNNFPFPKNPTNPQIKKVEQKAQAVLDIRAKYPDSSLADLYDPNTMPPDLLKAHIALDKAVDECYNTDAKSLNTERHRIEFLFNLYNEYTMPLNILGQ